MIVKKRKNVDYIYVIVLIFSFIPRVYCLAQCLANIIYSKKHFIFVMFVKCTFRRKT